MSQQQIKKFLAKKWDLIDPDRFWIHVEIPVEVEPGLMEWRTIIDQPLSMLIQFTKILNQMDKNKFDFENFRLGVREL